MESVKDISKLDGVPTDDKYNDLSFSEVIKAIDAKKSSDVTIEAACGAQAVMISLFEARNVPDSLTEAYRSSFTGSNSSLYEHYTWILGKGDAATTGFISNLKGKVFEVQLQDKLGQVYPDYDFSIAADPTNPIWDLKGVNVHDGTELLVQAKMGAAGYAGDVIDRMQDNPDILFAVSSEIQDKILSASPDLANQLLDVDVSNFDMSNEVNHNLQVLSDNLGIDVPDGIGDILPYVSEIILGIRLILDLIKVQRDFSRICAVDKTKLSAVKAIVLFGRFGISTVCTFLGASGGSFVLPPPFGQIGGALVGSGLSMYLNHTLKPHIMEIALGLTGLNQDDMFYFRNKSRIDNLASAFANTIV